MLESNFEKLYLKFRANYYKRMVEKISPREGSLSATENFCVEIIYLLGCPTVTEFADYLNISVPNANYKISNLEKKGYVTKRTSQRDKREQILSVTDKFTAYYGLNNKDNEALMRRIRESFTVDEVEKLNLTIQKVLKLMDAEDEKEESQ